MAAPLFSTYRQGENRVSASLLAVFERLGIDLVARILGAALEEPELNLVEYESQPSRGGDGTPDAEMRASFRFLFEVKTEQDAVVNEAAIEQLRRHLGRLDESHGAEFLVVLTPDADEPDLLTHIDDARAVWTSFEALVQAINGVLEDPSEPASEQQRFLLRELTDLFELDGLVGQEDVVIVAAGSAYELWLDHGAYVCQAGRAFRPVNHWGFYRSKNIEPEFPSVRRHFSRVEFSETTVSELVESDDPLDHELGNLVTTFLAESLQPEGAVADVRLLEAPNDPGLVQASDRIPHDSPGAWTQGQRYAYLEALLEAEATSDL